MIKTLPTQSVISAWTRLVRARDRAMAGVEGDLKSAGYPPLAWYDVLLELRRAGSQGVRPLELEQQLLIAQHNVSRLLDRMEEKGLIERMICPQDARGQLIVITGAGQALAKRMWPVYAAALQREIGDRLSEKEAERLACLLQKLAS